ncbi:hypothetical protein [Nonomuraea recticatena]|uniref:Excreted virulence factor EspC (Type VII ESX diderm) n=1 Tax=Nonomuraea recticatena TaxID=46178 RepID=A0ABN3TCG6_9ACTN
MRVDVAGAESAGRHMAGGAEAYGADVERLSQGLAGVGPVGPEGELVSALNEFTGALVEAAGRMTLAYSSTAAGMSASVDSVREAETAAVAVAGTTMTDNTLQGNTAMGDA